MELIIRFLATYLIIILTILAIYFTRKKIYFYLLTGLAGGGLIQIIIFFIKAVYQPKRPYLEYNLKPLVAIPPADSSFPSSHASISFMLATLIYYYNKKLGIIFYLLALSVSSGRVLANVHYPIDVIGGAVLGIFSAFIVNFMAKRCSNFN